MAVIELARVDGSMSTFLMVHNSLTMLTIGLLGSEAQKAELLPPMARLDWVGALLTWSHSLSSPRQRVLPCPLKTPCWSFVGGPLKLMTVLSRQHMQLVR